MLIASHDLKHDAVSLRATKISHLQSRWLKTLPNLAYHTSSLDESLFISEGVFQTSHAS